MKPALFIFLLGASAFAAVPGEATANACSVNDFAVEDFAISVRQCSMRSCPKYSLRGVLKNNCSAPAAARIEIRGVDANGAVVGNAEGWPASTRNLAPGEGIDFDFGPLIRFDDSIAEFKVAIIESKTW